MFLAELLLSAQHASVLRHSRTHCSTTSEVCRCTSNDCIGMLLCHIHGPLTPLLLLSLRQSEVVATSNNLKRMRRPRQIKSLKPRPHSDFSQICVYCRLMNSRNKVFACLNEFCRADIMEALPSKADPALAGGPVSLPSQAAVLHGVRSESLSQPVACCLGCCWGGLFQLFGLMCRASDYYSRSSSGRHDRHYDREPDRYQSEKHKLVAPTQVMTPVV